MIPANTNTNATPGALDAAAERKLAAIKADRIVHAESALKAASDRLARAQVAEETAAAALSRYDSNINRDRVLEARQEIELASSLVAHAEREVAKAKARTTPAEKAAALALVHAERSAATLAADLAPHLAAVRAAGAQLVAAVQALKARCANHSRDFTAWRDAHGPVGLHLDERAFPRTPSVDLQAAHELLQACTAGGLSPFDLGEIMPQRAVPLRLPSAGAVAHISPHEMEDREAVNLQVRERLELEVQRSDEAKAAYARQHPGRPVPAMPAQPPAPASTFGERASLYADD